MMKKLLTSLFVAGAMIATANAQDVSGTYAGTLKVDLGGTVTTQQDTIYLEDPEADGLYKVSIKDFSFMGLPIGDLEVTDIASAVGEDGTVTLTKEGEVAGPTVELMPGQPGMPTTITFGETTVKESVLSLNLSVSVAGGAMTVAVSFEGMKVTEDGDETGIASIAADKTEIAVWGNEMLVRGAAEYTIYNTAGVAVQQGVVDGNVISLDNLGGGIYLVKAGNHIEKFIKK